MGSAWSFSGRRQLTGTLGSKWTQTIQSSVWESIEVTCSYRVCSTLRSKWTRTILSSFGESIEATGSYRVCSTYMCIPYHGQSPQLWGFGCIVKDFDSFIKDLDLVLDLVDTVQQYSSWHSTFSFTPMFSKKKKKMKMISSIMTWPQSAVAV